MLGLSGIMQAGSAVFEVVRWAGVAYLVFMGISMLGITNRPSSSTKFIFTLWEPSSMRPKAIRNAIEHCG